jgi:hypothetical protein
MRLLSWKYMISAPRAFIKASPWPTKKYILIPGGAVAVRIDRVEREFILGSAAETKTEAKLRTAGRSMKCRVASFKGEGLSFTLPSDAASFVPRERVSVCFDFRGQAVAFEASVLSSASGLVELRLPEAMYRSLSRRWPRVSAPKDFSVEFLLPDSQLSLSCPESETWSDVELPELREGLDSKSLVALIDSFKAKASEIASEGRVIMYKDRGPGDVAEEMASRLGRSLYVPSTSGPLPMVDPYPSGRIITREIAEEFEGPAAVAQGSKLSSYLRGRALEGLKSGLWCPVVYYRYAVGMVVMSNGPEKPRALDFGAVDLAWEFSRILAWFLKRHGYFADSDAAAGPRKGGIIDASPAGLLAALPGGSGQGGFPSIPQGSVLRLRLSLKAKSIVCSGKVARRYEEGGMSYCGIAFMDLSAQDMATLSLGLYGEDEGRVEGGA